MYVLIVTIAMWGYSSNSGMGGAGVDIEKFETMEQCESVKGEFLNGMAITAKELTGYKGSRVTVIRKASCVKI